METRPGFAQKLLDDLRLRKQRLATDKHIDSSNADTKRASRSSREEYSSKTGKNNIPNTKVANVQHGTTRREGTAQDIVPFRKTNSQQRTDVSIALRNIEQFRNGTSGNKVILCGGTLNFREINGNKFPLLSPSQMIEISKDIQQLNMILRACSNGVIMSREAIDVGRELLRGSKNLEESLKILASLQYASNYMSSSSKNQIKLLKGNEDEPSSGEANNMKLIKPTFSFDKKSNRTNYKEKEIIDNDSILKCTNRSSSNSHLQFNYHRRSLSAEFNMKPTERNEDFRSSLQGINHSGNIKQYDDPRGGLRNEKVRIPSVVAKLMGLEELPLAMSEVKKKEVQYVHNSNQIKASGNINTHGKINVPKTKGEKIAKDKSSAHTIHVMDRENKNKVEPSNPKHKNSLYSENLKSTTRKQISVDDKEFMVPKNEATKAGKNLLAKQPIQGALVNQCEFKIQAMENSMQNVSFLHEHPKIVEREKERRGKNVVSISEINVKDVDSAIKQKQSPIQRSKIKQRMDNGTTKTKKNLKQIRAMFEIADNNVQKNSSSSTKHAKKTSANFSERNQPKQYRNEKYNEKNKMQKDSYVHLEVEDISTNKSLDVPGNTDEEVMQQICKLEPVPTAQKVEDKNYVNIINDNTVNLAEEIRTEITEVNLHNIKNKASFVHELEQRLKERALKSEEAKISYHTMKFEEHSQQNTPIIISLSSISDEIHENGLTQQVEDQQENDRNSILSQCTVVVDFACPHVSEIHAVEDQELPLLPENNKSEDTVHNYAEMHTIYKSEVLDQRLTGEECALKNILVNDSHFLNAAQALLKVNIPIGILLEAENICEDENNKLVLDTGYELMRKKCKREEALFTKKTPSALTKVRCFGNLIRELNNDFKSLEPQCMTDDNMSECLQYMIEKDIENRNPDVNCMWDTCWSNVVIAYVEKEEIVKDLEKHMLNGLINELVKDLMALHCIS